LPGHTLNPGGYPKALGEVQKLARQHGPRAVERLVECMEAPLRDDEGRFITANAKIVKDASQALLDRGFGKPAQTVRLEDEKGTGLEDISRPKLIDLLERQLAALKAQPQESP